MPRYAARVCRLCGKEKPAAEFYLQYGKPIARCRDCINARRRRHEGTTWTGFRAGDPRTLEASRIGVPRSIEVRRAKAALRVKQKKCAHQPSAEFFLGESSDGGCVKCGRFSYQPGHKFSNRMVVICVVCGRRAVKFASLVLDERKSTGLDYCSHGCLSLGRTTRTEAHCTRCGRAVPVHLSQIKRGLGKFCGRECYLQSASDLVRARGRKDANHAEVSEAFTAAGAKVLDASDVGGGFPDLMVLWRGRVHLVEVKNPSTDYGQRGLNRQQRAMVDKGWRISVARSSEEALTLLDGWA